MTTNKIEEKEKPTKKFKVSTTKKVSGDSAAPKQNTATVTVEKSKLDSILEKVEKQSKQIKMLTEVADKARLHKFESANQDFSQKIVSVSTYQGKIIVGWKTVKDEMYQNAKGQWVEDQQIAIYMIDNTKETMNYLDFTRNIKKVDGVLKSRHTTPEGEKMMRIDVMNKTIDLNETYVN